MADMCSIYTVCVTQKLEANWRNISKQWWFDSVTALTVHLYFNLFLSERWRGGLGLYQFHKERGEEDASFPSSHLTVLVVYGLWTPRVKPSWSFPHQKPALSWSSPSTAGSAPSLPLQTAPLNEERMDTHERPASKLSYVRNSTQALPCTEQELLTSTSVLEQGSHFIAILTNSGALFGVTWTQVQQWKMKFFPLLEKMGSGPKALLSSLDTRAKMIQKKNWLLKIFPIHISNHYSIDLPHTVQTPLKKGRLISWVAISWGLYVFLTVDRKHH